MNYRATQRHGRILNVYFEVKEAGLQKHDLAFWKGKPIEMVDRLMVVRDSEWGEGWLGDTQGCLRVTGLLCVGLRWWVHNTVTTKLVELQSIKSEP